MFGRRRPKFAVHEIAPEEIFLDSSNLPDLRVTQFEGRVVREVPRRAIFGVGAFFIVIACIYGGRAFDLQIAHGASYADISLENSLSSNIIFAQRGIIYDRNGKELAWNVAAPQTASS